MKIKYPNIPIGTKINFLKIIGEPESVKTVAKNGRINIRLVYPCECMCGTKTKVRAHCLRTLITKSCGCKVTKRGSVKGARKEKHPLYSIWSGMITRCHRTKNPTTAKNYKDKGVIVCEEWRSSFEKFCIDVGERPSIIHTLDRIDYNGNYCKENCRWATVKEQNNNTSANIIVTYNGEKCKLIDLEHISIVRRQLITARLKRGWTVERAISTPSKYQEFINKK